MCTRACPSPTGFILRCWRFPYRYNRHLFPEDDEPPVAVSRVSRCRKSIVREVFLDGSLPPSRHGPHVLSCVYLHHVYAWTENLTGALRDRLLSLSATDRAGDLQAVRLYDACTNVGDLRGQLSMLTMRCHTSCPVLFKIGLTTLSVYAAELWSNITFMTNPV